jgi:hypothetical protein
LWERARGKKGGGEGKEKEGNLSIFHHYFLKEKLPPYLLYLVPFMNF